MTMWAGSSPDQLVRGWPHSVEAARRHKSANSIAVVLIKDAVIQKRRTATMTALAAPRLATRPRVARPTALSHFRESFSGFRGAVRAVTETRGSDYADALLLGRN